MVKLFLLLNCETVKNNFLFSNVHDVAGGANYPGSGINHVYSRSPNRLNSGTT